MNRSPSITRVKVPISTPAGTYVAEVTPRGVARLTFPADKSSRRALPQVEMARPQAVQRIARQLQKELASYHKGTLKRFTVPVDLEGHTVFRRRVWRVLRSIPYGRTRSYGQVAASIGCRGPRAVGQACAANPVPVIIPCHRVLCSDGAVGGWSGRPGFKERLLALEGVGQQA